MRQILKNNKSIFLIIFIKIIASIFIESILCAQTDKCISLSIMDTLLIRKPNEDAVRVRLKISAFNKQEDTLFMYMMHRYVPSNPFFYNKIELEKYKNSPMGLIYIVENSSGDIVSAEFQDAPSFKKVDDEIRYSQSEFIVNKHLKIKRILLTKKERHEYNLSKIELAGEKTIEVFPLLKAYHSIQKGTYYLFFYYAFNDLIDISPPLWDQFKPKDKQIVRGNYISNKVKLIIE